MFKRILLFGLVNILIVVTISIILNILGVGRYTDGSSLNITNLAIFCLVWGMVGSFVSLLISRITAKFIMGVKVINPEAASSDEKMLLSTVYYLAQKAGLSGMPEVGIYESPEINAFATGPTKNRALVAVSSGLLSRMNSVELEGVLAHEVAHIANGDMVTMTLVQGVVNAFVMFFARIISFAISQTVEEERRHMVQFLTTIVFEILFGILGSMVVAWFSRAREFRADTHGAMLAGREKMLGALVALTGSLDMVDDNNASIAAFKISSNRGGFFALFSTHPPLEERIARLQQM